MIGLSNSDWTFLFALPVVDTSADIIFIVGSGDVDFNFVWLEAVLVDFWSEIRFLSEVCLVVGVSSLEFILSDEIHFFIIEGRLSIFEP